MSGNKVEDAILAFRTITTMIGVFQRKDFECSAHSLHFLSVTSNAPDNPGHTTDTEDLGVAAFVNLNYPTVANPHRSERIPGHRMDALLFDGTQPAVMAPREKISVDYMKPLEYVRRSWYSQTFQNHAKVVVDMIAHCQKLGSSTEAISAAKGSLLQNPFRGWIDVSVTKLIPDPFLTVYMPKDAAWLTRIPSITSYCDIEVPLLMRVARRHGQLEPTQSDELSIYNPETCIEFHKVLCTLLANFRRELAELVRYTNKFQKKGYSPGWRKFRRHVIRIKYFGLCLRKVAYSPALEAHITLIKDLLEAEVNSRQATGICRAKPAGALSSNDEEEELREVQPMTISQERPLDATQAFMKWLRLITDCFESSRMLAKPLVVPSVISIKVVAVPHQGQRMLCWKDLVRTLYKSPVEANVIIETIETLITGCKYFQENFCEGTPLSTGVGFEGTLHCEVCIASLVCLSDDAKEKMGVDIKTVLQNLQSLLGVSKRCCPVCSRVLQVLRNRLDVKFDVLGSHKTVTGCTLPPWLPEDIISDIVYYFEQQLVDILSKVVDESRRLRDPKRSTDSYITSPSSSDDDEPHQHQSSDMESDSSGPGGSSGHDSPTYIGDSSEESGGLNDADADAEAFKGRAGSSFKLV